MATRARERQLDLLGFRRIAGVDEVGVGPLAGPVVAAAVILPEDFDVEGVRDSKLVDESERARLEAEILDRCVASAIGQASVSEIDSVGIYLSSALAMRRAVEALSVSADYLLVDARHIDIDLPQEGPVRGDGLHTCIAAASIVAKQFRDRLMADLDRRFPGYGLAEHKGYPTKRHFEALAKLGPAAVHRISWLAVREAAGTLSALYYDLLDHIRCIGHRRQMVALDARLALARAEIGEDQHQRLKALLRRRATRL